MFCENCGKPLVSGALFCENCGCKVVQSGNVQPTNKTKKNNKMVIFVIIIFVLMAVLVFTGIFAVKKAKQKKQAELLEELTENIPSYSEEIPVEEEPAIEEELPIEEVPIKEEIPQEIDYSYIDVEDQVEIIREEYNLIVDSISKDYYTEESLGNGATAYYDGGELKSVIVSKGGNGLEYTQYYYYDDDALIFAYYEASDSHRLYFYEDQLMRWRYCKNAQKASEAVNHDWDDSAEYNDWENTVYSIGNTYL